MLLPVLEYAWLSVVAVPAKVSMVPSPHETLRLLMLPPLFGSEAVIVMVILVPVEADVADSVKLTVGACLCVMVFVEVVLLVVEPELSVALTYTWYVFAVAYAWLSVLAVPASLSTVPSPFESFSELPVSSGSAVVIVSVIVVLVVAVVADLVNDTVGARSLMVLVAVADLVVDPLLSVAFT